jgi:hypothetical protein
MDTVDTFQLISALCFTVVGILFLTRRGAGERTRKQGHLAGTLFLIAAAANWLLFAKVFS